MNKIFSATSLKYFIAVLLTVFLVSAAVIIQNNSTVNLDKSITLSDDIPDTIAAFAGDYKEYSINIQNKANQPRNYSITYWVDSNITINNNDLKIRFINNGITENQSSTVDSGKVSLIIGDKQLNSNELKTYNLSVEFNPGAQNGSYYMHYMILPGTINFK